MALKRENSGKKLVFIYLTLRWKWRQTWFCSSVSLCRVVGLDTRGIKNPNFPFPCCLRTAPEMCLSSKVHSLPCVKMVKVRVLIHFAWEITTRHKNWVKPPGWWPRGSWIHFGFSSVAGVCLSGSVKVMPLMPTHRSLRLSGKPTSVSHLGMMQFPLLLY